MYIADTINRLTANYKHTNKSGKMDFQIGVFTEFFTPYI